MKTVKAYNEALEKAGLDKVKPEEMTPTQKEKLRALKEQHLGSKDIKTIKVVVAQTVGYVDELNITPGFMSDYQKQYFSKPTDQNYDKIIKAVENYQGDDSHIFNWFNNQAYEFLTFIPVRGEQIWRDADDNQLVVGKDKMEVRSFTEAPTRIIR